MKPCIIISPDIVPTEELDSPADKRPIPNKAADTGPTKLLNWLKATSRSSTCKPF